MKYPVSSDLLAKLANERLESQGRKGTSVSPGFEDVSATSVVDDATESRLKLVFVTGLEKVKLGSIEEASGPEVGGIAVGFRPRLLLKLKVKGLTSEESVVVGGFVPAGEKIKPDFGMSELTAETVVANLVLRAVKPEPTAGIVKVVLGEESMLENSDVCCDCCPNNVPGVVDAGLC